MVCRQNLQLISPFLLYISDGRVREYFSTVEVSSRSMPTRKDGKV